MIVLYLLYLNYFEYLRSISMATPLPPPENPLIRLSFYFNRSPDMTDAEFHSYWRHKHGALVVASQTFLDSNVQKYTQIRKDTALDDKAKAMGLQVVDTDWDGCSEIDFRSWDDYMQFAGSQEMREVVAPDGDRMTDTNKGIRVMFSRVDPIFDRA